MAKFPWPHRCQKASWLCLYCLLGSVYSSWTTLGNFKGGNLSLSWSSFKKCPDKWYAYASQACCLEKFAACHCLCYGMLRRYCRALSKPLIKNPLVFCVGTVGMLVAPWWVWKVLQRLELSKTDNALQSSAGEGKGYKEEGSDFMC